VSNALVILRVEAVPGKRQLNAPLLKCRDTAVPAKLHMLRQNAPAALFSYLRPIVTQITVEANIPPLVLPLMNFTEKEQ